MQLGRHILLRHDGNHRAFARELRKHELLRDRSMGWLSNVICNLCSGKNIRPSIVFIVAVHDVSLGEVNLSDWLTTIAPQYLKRRMIV